MILRCVDNLFFNTPNVGSLATFYSSGLGLPICRETQVPTLPCGDAYLWAEIAVGGVQLSFRRAGGTECTHPEFDRFSEAQPASGATVSFRVDEMNNARRELRHRGVSFVGEIFSCTGGKELLSVFEDPWGRTFQLYESRFEENEVDDYYPPQLTHSRHFARHRSPSAMQVAFYQDNPSQVLAFFAETLELPLASIHSDRVLFRLGTTIIEFIQREHCNEAGCGFQMRGGVPVFVADQPKYIKRQLQSIGAPISEVRSIDATRSPDFRTLVHFVDPDGNIAQLRSSVSDLVVA